jgi:hypothetical protein
MAPLSPSASPPPVAPPPPPWPAAIPGSREAEPFSAADLHRLLRGDFEADELEQLLAQVARARGALDVAVGDGLAALSRGERLIGLGYSCLGDYAREALGIQERTAQGLAHLSRELRSRPLLRAAVCAGEVKQRAAEAVLPLARGEAEEGWVERARWETVRALLAAVKRERSGVTDLPEPWVQLRAGLEPEDRAEVDAALELAGRVLGPGSRRPERLEAVAAEYLGSHPIAPLEEHALDGTTAMDRGKAAARERAEARLEVETQGWWLLSDPVPVRVPEEGFEERTSAEAIDRRLRELAEMRASWDDALGHCALAVKATGLHRVLGFASFAHYARERLGLSERTVQQRAALERRLWESPALKAAHLAGLSCEKLRLLSRLPDSEIAAWVPRARELTCIALRRALETGQEAQLCAARLFTARVPMRISHLLRDAFRAVRSVEGAMLPDGKCLLALARHFTATWKEALPKRRSRSQRIRARDLGHCQVPECSRAATHAHHIIPRSQGGSDDPSNLVALCTCHHFRGIHAGRLKVRGLAPDGLRWERSGEPFSSPPPPSRSTGAPLARSPAARGRAGPGPSRARRP